MNPAEDYILSKKEPYRSILLHLKAVVEATIPNVELKFKWNIPCFYADKSPICYLNASQKKKYVDIAFWNSAHLTKHVELLVTEKRKVIKSLRYSTLEEINNEVLVAVLENAYAVRRNGFY